MDRNKFPIILLTNDDGIDSPGLWAAVDGLAELGDLWIVAPRDQSSSAGRSMPPVSDGIIQSRTKNHHGRDWPCFAVGGTPAQVINHAIYEILPQRPAIVISGINYGANTGIDITRSGTLGAALEAANFGIPAIAVSRVTEMQFAFSHSGVIDFSTAAFFTSFFTERVLRNSFPDDMKVLKVEVPANATPDTSWKTTFLDPNSLYLSSAIERDNWEQPGGLRYRIRDDHEIFKPGSDAYVVFVEKLVAVTPLSLDLTARIDLNKLDGELRAIPKD